MKHKSLHLSELDLIRRILYDQVKAGIQDQWGIYGCRGNTLRFTECGYAKLAAVFGWIMGIEISGNVVFARCLAEDLISQLDGMADTKGYMEVSDLKGLKWNGVGNPSGVVPTVLYELSSDYDMYDFRFSRWEVIEDQAHETWCEGFNTFHCGLTYPDTDILYAPQFNGGLIYHGPDSPEEFSETWGRSLWQTHT